MKRIGCYDDTADLIDVICEKLDITEPELVDRLIDAATEGIDTEIAEIIDKFYTKR